MEDDFQTGYIYLDYEERKRFSAASHDYLFKELKILKIKDMILWIFVCKNSDIWKYLPCEIHTMILDKIQK